MTTVFLIAPDFRTLGGYELQLQTLALKLAQAGVQVHLFVRDAVDPTHPYWQTLVASSVNCYSAPTWLKRRGERNPEQVARTVQRIVWLAAPLLLLSATVDALVRRRSWLKSWRGAFGVLHAQVNKLAQSDMRQWLLERKMDRVRLQTPPDVIDVQHSMITAAIGYATRHDFPLVYTEYGAPNEALRSVWEPLLGVVNSADFIIHRAEASLSGLQAIADLDPTIPTRLIPNAVVSVPQDSVDLTLPTATPLIIMAIGRLAPEKSPLLLLAAFKQLVDANLDVALCYAGDGPLRSELEQQIARWQLSSRVTITGRFDTIHPLMRRAAIVAHPTRNDGRSVAVLEAMAWGRAVVGTDVGGVAELIADGQTGLLVPPDDADALASALRQLVEDADLRDKLGVAAREAFLAGQFSAEAMVNATIDVYEKVISAAHGKQMLSTSTLVQAL